MNEISPLKPIPAYTKTDHQQSGKQQNSTFGKLETGQLVKAVVLESRGNNNILLQVGDNQFVAKSEIPLPSGKTVQLQILSTSPQLQFKIVNNAVDQLLGRPLTLVGNSINITTLFQSLQSPSSLFESLSQNSQQILKDFFTLQQGSLLALTGGTTDTGGSVLSQLINSLGIGLEQLLSSGDSKGASNTLKAALLEMVTNLQANSQESSSASKLLGTLEFFQLAQLRTDSGQQFIFPLPLTFLEQGFLVVEKKDGQNGKQIDYADTEYRFSLHLQLTGIGNLRIDIFHNKEGIRIRFQTESQEKSDFIALNVKDLEDSLTEKPILGISFGNNATDPATEIVKLIQPEGKSFINTKA